MGRKLGYATVAIMKAIRRGYAYGVDIMEVTGLPSGTVYPALGSLEERGFVRSRWERRAEADAERRPRRRYYRLTGSGESALDGAIQRLALLTDSDSSPASIRRTNGDELAPGTIR